MRRSIFPMAAAAALLGHAVLCSGELRFNVVFNDPQNLLDGFRSQIESNALAAARMWAEHLDGDADLTIRITGTNNFPRGFGRSVVGVTIAFRDGFNIREQGAAYEIRTGIDPNGTGDDIEIGLNPNYVANELWFDPNPDQRTTTVPSTRTDAVSVMLHELGHAFAFNGWIDGENGTFPGDFKSTWDEMVVFDGVNFFFTGTRAQSVYGGPVPVTFGNRSHIGNRAPRPGEDLIPALMNGVVFFRGRRYYLDEIELAIFEDVGIPMRAPCPADLTGDGLADVFDLLAYLNLWFAMDPAADRTNDEPIVIDVFDLLAYLDDWFTGCP